MKPVCIMLAVSFLDLLMNLGPEAGEYLKSIT